MHTQVRDWIAQHTTGRTFSVAVECGSRYINGRVRDLITADTYIGVDTVDGVDVDVVADFCDWTPEQPADLVVCCEVLEHAQDPERVVAQLLDVAAEGALVLITCATDPREPHSSHDGSRQLADDEHYRNIPKAHLERWLDGHQIVELARHKDRGDLYAAVVKV